MSSIMSYLLFLVLFLLASTTTSFAEDCTATNDLFDARPRSRWPANKASKLFYYISPTNNPFPTYILYQEFEKAFDQWKDVTCIQFQMISIQRAADIVILFQNNPALGVGTTSPAPPATVTITLNSGLTWEISNTVPTGSYHLPSVALHQIGHAIGLRHAAAAATNAIMNPTFTAGERKATIRGQDRNDVLRLYGECLDPPN